MHAAASAGDRLCLPTRCLQSMPARFVGCQHLHLLKTKEGVCRVQMGDGSGGTVSQGGQLSCTWH